MQEGEVGARTETRRGQRVARRLFPDRDQDQDLYHNHDRNNDEGSAAARPYAGVEDNLTNRLSEEARQDLAKAKTRWNFDFENERPLPGRWDWRKVGGGRNEGENCSMNEDSDFEGEEKTDENEKSETEANEKAEAVVTTGGKD